MPFANRAVAQIGWSIQWSSPTGLDTEGRRLPGGTCLLWSKTLGRGLPMSSDPSVCARQWPQCCVASVYGPAGQANVTWLAQSLLPFESLDVPSFLIGDFNWRPCYDHVVPANWCSSEPVVTVVGSKRCPTRAVWPQKWVFSSKPETVLALPGIPHHCATFWSIPIHLMTSNQAIRRVRRCANFSPVRQPTNLDILGLEEFAQKCWDQPDPLENDSSEVSIWDSQLAVWHAVAEKTLHSAVSRGLCALTRPAERPKGSFPSTKPFVASSVSKAADTIPLRRCKRLHRAAAEQLRRGHAGGLTPTQLRHWCAALSSRLVPHCITRLPCDQADAINLANSAIAALINEQNKQSKESWSQKFRSWQIDSIKATKPVLCPSAAPSPASADELLEAWSPQLIHSDPVDRSSNWVRVASDVGLQVASPGACDVPFEPFCSALALSKGALGLDGWTTTEVRFLTVACPWLVRRLFTILCSLVSCAGNLTQADVTGDSYSALQSFFTWRLAAVPKRDSEDSRPVAVGSVLLRAFHKVLLQFLPLVPDGQWGGRKGVGVVHATISWLSHPGTVGTELDLSKAFDLVHWDVAKTALSKVTTKL